MKQCAKNLLERFRLSHIRWMIVGFLLTELITWLLYKNPKKITAPGLSATVAVFALILAVYSAYQVKKWLNGKVNEKGFKKCEIIIDKTQQIAMAVVKIDRGVKKIFQMNLVILEAEKYEVIVHQIDEQKKIIDESIIEIYTHAMHLNIWGFEMSQSHSLDDLTEGIKAYNSATNSIIGNSKKFPETGNYKEAENDESEYKKGLKKISLYIDKVNHSTFSEIFIPYKKPKHKAKSEETAVV